MFGLAPLVASAWISKIAATVTSPLESMWPVLLVLALIAVGWMGGSALFRLVESRFRSLNSVSVEPAYVVCREVLRHIVGGAFRSRITQPRLAKLRAVAAVAGVALCGLAIWYCYWFEPMSRLALDISDLTACLFPLR